MSDQEKLNEIGREASTRVIHKLNLEYVEDIAVVRKTDRLYLK
jgi:hypothetical protein